MSVDSTVARVHQHGATAPGRIDRKPAAAAAAVGTAPAAVLVVEQLGSGTAGPTGEPQGEPSNYKVLPDPRYEPGDHGIGRSRGGLTTTCHALVDGHGLPLVLLIPPGQARDSKMLGPLLAALRVPRVGPGRARTRPDALLGDDAYSARTHRGHLRERGITTVIPEPADELDDRVRRGRAGGRPVNVNKVLYKRRNVVERAFNKLKNWRGIATRYDKHAVNYRAGVVLGAVFPWLRHVGDTP